MRGEGDDSIEGLPFETAAESLSVTATSDNDTLLPAASFKFEGSGAERTLTVTPAADQNGSGVVTVTVSDGVNAQTETFKVTVNAVNDVPVAADDSATTDESMRMLGDRALIRRRTVTWALDRLSRRLMRP